MWGCFVVEEEGTVVVYGGMGGSSSSVMVEAYGQKDVGSLAPDPWNGVWGRCIHHKGQWQW